MAEIISFLIVFISTFFPLYIILTVLYNVKRMKKLTQKALYPPFIE